MHLRRSELSKDLVSQRALEIERGPEWARVSRLEPERARASHYGRVSRDRARVSKKREALKYTTFCRKNVLFELRAEKMKKMRYEPTLQFIEPWLAQCIAVLHFSVTWAIWCSMLRTKYKHSHATISSLTTKCTIGMLLEPWCTGSITMQCSGWHHLSLESIFWTKTKQGQAPRRHIHGQI